MHMDKRGESLEGAACGARICMDATVRISAQMEQLAVGAAKEQAIETKLAGIGAEWAVASLTFANYKTRGPVILKVPAQCRSCLVST